MAALDGRAGVVEGDRRVEPAVVPGARRPDGQALHVRAGGRDAERFPAHGLQDDVPDRTLALDAHRSVHHDRDAIRPRFDDDAVAVLRRGHRRVDLREGGCVGRVHQQLAGRVARGEGIARPGASRGRPERPLGHRHGDLGIPGRLGVPGNARRSLLRVVRVVRVIGVIRLVQRVAAGGRSFQPRQPLPGEASPDRGPGQEVLDGHERPVRIGTAQHARGQEGEVREGAAADDPRPEPVRPVLAAPVGRLRQVQGVGQPPASARAADRRHDEAQERARPENGVLRRTQDPDGSGILRGRQQHLERAVVRLVLGRQTLRREHPGSTLEHAGREGTGRRLQGAGRVEHVVRVVTRTGLRVGLIIQLPALRQVGAQAPRERGLERDTEQQIGPQPGHHVPVEERAAAGGDGAVLRVVHGGRERPEGVQAVQELVRGRLVRDVPEDGRPRTDVPERLTTRTDRRARPDALTEPVAPPREAARLAHRPLAVDGHGLVRTLDGLQAQVLARRPYGGAAAVGSHVLILLSHPAGAPCRREGRRPVAAPSASRDSRALVIGAALCQPLGDSWRSCTPVVPPVWHDGPGAARLCRVCLMPIAPGGSTVPAEGAGRSLRGHRARSLARSGWLTST